jgi:hypothetical protein
MSVVDARNGQAAMQVNDPSLIASKARDLGRIANGEHLSATDGNRLGKAQSDAFPDTTTSQDAVYNWCHAPTPSMYAGPSTGAGTGHPIRPGPSQ